MDKAKGREGNWEGKRPERGKGEEGER